MQSMQKNCQFDAFVYHCLLPKADKSNQCKSQEKNSWEHMLNNEKGRAKYDKYY